MKSAPGQLGRPEPLRAEVSHDAVSFIAAAARLRARARAWEKQLKQHADNHKIIFFVDNDVVTLFTNPGRTRGGSYGQIFPNDNRVEVIAIAALLGEYIFSDLTDSFPLLQFPSHAQELTSLIDQVSKHATRVPDWNAPLEEQLSEQNQAAAKELAESGDQIDGDFAELLYDVSGAADHPDFDDLVGSLFERIFRSNSANLELTRFLKLFSNGQIAPIDAVPSHFLERLPIECQRAFQGPGDVHEMVELAMSAKAWLKKLREFPTPQKKIESIELDARALSYLEFINNKIFPCGYIACLITGDSSIWRLARRFPQLGLAKWIIDPRSLLIDALDNWTANQEDGAFHFAIKGILSPIDLGEIGRLSEHRAPARAALSERLENVDDSVAEIYRKNIKQWNVVKEALLKDGFLTRSSYSSIFVEFAHQISSFSRSDIRTQLTELRHRMERDLADEWRKLEDNFSQIGISLLLALRVPGSIRDWRPRNPPAVMFESYEATDKLARLLLREREGSPVLAGQIAKIGTDGKTSPERRYLTFLVYAILCAAEGRWYAARTFAERAASIGKADLRSGSGSPLDGREALFVLAQSERCLAESISDMDLAATHLAEARSLLESRRGIKGAFHELKLARFDCESVAFEISGLHFRTWIDRERISEDEILRVFAEVSFAFENVVRIGRPVQSDRGEREMFDTLISYLFINCVQLAHVDLHSKRGLGGDILRKCREIWAVCDEDRQGGGDRTHHASYLIMSYRMLFFALTRHKIDHTLLSRMSNSIDEYSVVSYDKKRFRSLFKIIEKLRT